MNQNKRQTAIIIELPAPESKGGMPLEKALALRRSVREFRRNRLTERELSQLLWAAQGVTSLDGLRTAPSAGAIYPLEIWCATPSGFYHYEPREHRLTQYLPKDLRPEICRAGLMQEAILEAPVVFVITAVNERMAHKYGEDRAPRYIHMEAGHAAQNLLLEAVALKLAGVPIGAFNDQEVGKVLSLPAEQRPLYLIAVGHPR